MADSIRMLPMGLTVSEGRIYINVDFAGESCKLVLYRRGKTEPEKVFEFSKNERMGNVWSMIIDEGVSDIIDCEYCYEVDGELVSDPYGKRFTGRDKWGDLEKSDMPIRALIETDSFDWEGDTPLEMPYEDMVVYRLHPRGFTNHVSSKVHDRGTFSGIIEKIPYIKSLGVTAVELMPAAEFDEVIMQEGCEGNPYGDNKPTGKINYWGYAKTLHFAPKQSYCQSSDSSEEYKHLVKELHKSGLEVIQEMYFTGKEKPQYVLEAVRYWVMEYHLDGIHLVGFAPHYLIGSDPYLSHTKIWGISWENAPANKKRFLGEYNDGFMIDMRKLLKGDEDQMNNLIFRSKRNPSSYAVINYMANTNGFTLSDMLSYEMKHNEANGENNQDGNAYNYTWNCGVEGPTRRKKVVELRKKQLRNALVILFLSQGTPLLLAGDEFGNSQNGNNNAYCQDNEISWLNWNQKRSNKDTYEFVKFIIQFRKAHPVFHMTTEPRVMDYMACGHPDVSYHGVNAWRPEFENFRRQLGIMYCGEYAETEDKRPDDYFFVSYNMHWEPHEFALPTLPKKMSWYLCINTDDGINNGFYEGEKEKKVKNQKGYVVPARTIVVFRGRKDSL